MFLKDGEQQVERIFEVQGSPDFKPPYKSWFFCSQDHACFSVRLISPGILSTARNHISFRLVILFEDAKPSTASH